MGAAGMCVGDVENRDSGCLGRGRPIPNNWEEGEGEGEEEE